MSDLSTKNWCFDVGLACWDFQLVFGDAYTDNKSKQVLLREGVIAVIQVMASFADISRTLKDTHSNKRTYGFLF